MTWEGLAVKSCSKRRLMVLGFEGGWVFVSGVSGEPFPVGEDVVAKWIKEDDNNDEERSDIKTS